MDTTDITASIKFGSHATIDLEPGMSFVHLQHARTLRPSFTGDEQSLVALHAIDPASPGVGSGPLAGTDLVVFVTLAQAAAIGVVAQAELERLAGERTAAYRDGIQSSPATGPRPDLNDPDVIDFFRRTDDGYEDPTNGEPAGAES